MDVLEEAVAIIRAFWSGQRSVSFQRAHYRVRLLVAVPGEKPVGCIRRLGEDVAPRVRQLLE